MNTIFLALGSNVGDSHKFINDALTLLSKKITHIHSASLYITKAVGYTQQGDFLNTVIQGETLLNPQELLHFTKEIEKQVGRIKRFRWGPREIDIDILFYNNLILTENNLEIPHPRLHERDFVLVPLRELSRSFIHPHLNKSIQRLLMEFPDLNSSILKKIP